MAGQTTKTTIGDRSYVMKKILHLLGKYNEKECTGQTKLNKWSILERFFRIQKLDRVQCYNCDIQYVRRIGWLKFSTGEFFLLYKKNE